MIAVVTVLLALPLGFFVPNRTAAFLAYVTAYLWAFTFQSVYLLLDAMGGGTSGFSPDTFPLSYGAVTAAILAVGVGLVALGHRLGARRRAAQPTVV